ncbi:hypothetical protein [Microcoleus vaginatus]|uniref:hypothetical protein n=1 Tax=Microcoleus vaginatus TaxID=119532 RepID=UPI00403F4490
MTIQPIAIAPAIKHRMLRYFKRENFVLTRRRDWTGGWLLWRRGPIGPRGSIGRRGGIGRGRRRRSTCITVLCYQTRTISL